MDRVAAKRRIESLLRMTVARGCTEPEAATARRLADVLAAKYGFKINRPASAPRPNFDERFERAERKAAARFKWEYRRCGKGNCHCARAATPPHGPYRYGKKRTGRKVSSVYYGR